MKKLKIIFILLICFSLLNVSKANSLNLYPLTELATNSEFSFYTISAPASPELFEIKTSGQGYECKCDSSLALSLNRFIKNKIGEQITFKNCNISADEIISKIDGKIIYKDNMSIYGYSDNFNNYYIIDGNKINFQIYQCDNAFKIGTPILLGWN